MDPAEFLNQQITGIQQTISGKLGEIAQHQKHNEQLDRQIEALDQAIRIAEDAKEKVQELKRRAAGFDHGETWKGPSRDRHEQHISGGGSAEGALGHDLVGKIDGVIGEMRTTRGDLASQKDYLAAAITSLSGAVQTFRDEIGRLTNQLLNLQT